MIMIIIMQSSMETGCTKKLFMLSEDRTSREKVTLECDNGEIPCALRLSGTVDLPLPKDILKIFFCVGIGEATESDWSGPVESRIFFNTHSTQHTSNQGN